MDSSNKKDKIQDVILKRTEDSKKTYNFADAHNSRIPADWWFQNSPEGLVLFLVFYSQACRWAKCLGCNLPSKMASYHIGFKDIMRQVDFVFNNLLDDTRKPLLKKVILSNNGSVLDEATLSTTALLYFVARMNEHCPNVSVLTIETRPEYVDWAELEVLNRAIREHDEKTGIEIAIGFEAFDDSIRNDHFHKGLELEKFEALAKMVSRYKFKLKTYFMQKPVPGISEEEGVEDIIAGIKYLNNISLKYNISVNMHLNPTYAAEGTELARAFDRELYSPPLLESVRRAVLTAEGTSISIYVGLNDEGLAVPGGSFIRKGDEALIEKLEQFNRTQDYSLLK